MGTNQGTGNIHFQEALAYMARRNLQPRPTRNTRMRPRIAPNGNPAADGAIAPETGAKAGEDSRNSVTERIFPGHRHGQAPPETVDRNHDAEGDYELFREMLALENFEWLEEALFQERHGFLFDQFYFNVNIIINIGAFCGVVISPHFMADPAYLEILGGLHPPTDGNRDTILRHLGAFLSPPMVAERVVDFSASLYTPSGSYDAGADSERSRQGYSDGILNLTNHTYEQTKAVADGFGVSEGATVALTRDLTKRGLGDFVRNGPDTLKAAPGGMYERLREYANAEPMYGAAVLPGM